MLIVLVVPFLDNTQTHAPSNSINPSLPGATGNLNRPLIRFGRFFLRADHHMYLTYVQLHQASLGVNNSVVKFIKPKTQN